VKTRKHASSIVSRVRKNWSEMSYAQRRLFELRTGVSASTGNRRARARREIETLNALYNGD
jgi:hypothetical protein